MISDQLSLLGDIRKYGDDVFNDLLEIQYGEYEEEVKHKNNMYELSKQFMRQAEEAKEIIGDIKLDDCTCYKCLYQLDCESAYDLYNTNGDCLGFK